MPIEALEPGVAGNVRANTINTVSGACASAYALATRAQPTAAAPAVRVVTQQDKDNLLAQVQAEVDAKPLRRCKPNWNPAVAARNLQIFTIAQAFDRFNDDEATKCASLCAP